MKSQLAEVLATMDLFLMASIETSLAGQKRAIVAESFGLGVCFVGAIRRNAPKVCKLPPGGPPAGLKFGYVLRTVPQGPGHSFPIVHVELRSKSTWYKA